MTSYTGVGVSAGRVVGKVIPMAPPVAEPPAGAKFDTSATTPDDEANRVKDAALAVRDALRARAASAKIESQAILQATAQMAADPSLRKGAMKLVKEQGLTAERAVWDTADDIAAKLAALGDYMIERQNDVHDVRNRIVAELRGEQPPGIPESDDPFILTAVDLAPADTALLDPHKVLALVTSSGGPQSHTAIIARQLGLPAIVAAVGVNTIPAGTEVFVDGAAGSVDDEVTDEHRQRAEQWAVRQANPLEFDGDGRLKDGHKVQLLANIGGAKDAEKAVAANAEGVGLFRTEFLFLGTKEEPSLEKQEQEYSAVFAQFPGRKVVVRTLDAGADKPLPFLTDESEPNPALGVRGFRCDLATPGVLGNQLTAIARAAFFNQADVWVMAPMISTVAEATDFVQMCESAGLKRPGVMIEVPSAALCADHVLVPATFASIGTNDLTQYTMAADRQLGALAELNDPWQPGVLRLVKATCDGARVAGKGDPSARPVGVCGEAAGDPAMAVVLVGVGVASLSMTPRSLPAVGTVLKSVTLEEARDIAAQVLDARSAADAKAVARRALPILDELGL
ncbi:MAG TPA: phosphoenolpyruvate--protein phosphotransferase [Propionibacteriaceae bacterium]|nr:phosphoenolpyruvate--protein phosphotransferase [Propionibacteriaceae bacterium]